jgi:ribosomal protein S18 acetylase RimI-like enzyme
LNADFESQGHWLSPVTIYQIQLSTKLWPYRCADPAMAGAEKRALPALLPLLRDPPARQKAWMLLTLAVHPAFQKKGLGTMLVKHGLERADKEDLTAWLISREGLEGWYGRLGFVEKGRANIGELAKWDGGAVMFREQEQS